MQSVLKGACKVGIKTWKEKRTGMVNRGCIRTRESWKRNCICNLDMEAKKIKKVD